MRLLLRVLVLAALMVPGAAAAQVADCTAVRGGIDSPIAIFSVNGVCVDLSDSIVEVVDNKVWSLDVDDFPVNDLQIPLAIVDITAVFNADPFINFGATTTNLLPVPTTYEFLFGTPIVPGFYNFASSTGGVTVTSSPEGNATVDNSAVYPTYISGYGTAGVVPTNLGVDLGTAPCTATGPPASTTVCNQGSTSDTFPPTFYDNLEALLTYTQTGQFSVASWSGNVTLDVAPGVPEPATVTLLAVSSLALGVVGFARQRRRQS